MGIRLAEQIGAALDNRVDPERFEACAVELLRPYYKSLKRVPGPNDAGQDGLGETESGTKFVLVVTTSSRYAENLRKSIRSYLDAGGKRRSFVLATSRVVSGRSLLKLPAKIEDLFGVRLLAIHHREEFVELLSRDPSWRKNLLELDHGPVGGLTREFQRAHAELSLGLIGRDDEVCELAQARGDLIICGLPGIGKSYLLEHLCKERDWGWLVRDHNQAIPSLADEIVEKRPVRIIIDDAHFDVQPLARLAQLRQEISHSFDIVACCWRSGEDQVQAQLPGAPTFTLQELERRDIHAAIQQAGVHGPDRLIREILDQARGRIGLAVTMAQACKAGDGWEVVSGQLLAKAVLTANQRELSDDFLHEMGAIALFDEQGLTLDQVAGLLNRNVASVASAVRRVASSGTIEMPSKHDRRIRIQPRSLRYALVQKAWFSGPGALDVRSILAQVEHPAAAAIPLIVAASQDASLERTLIEKVIDWNDEESVCAYAELGIEEFERAASLSPQHLASIARTSIAAHGISERILVVLLEAEALAPESPGADNDQDRPLRIVAGHLSRRSSSIAERSLIVRVATGWSDTGGHDDVAAEAVLAALHPGVDDHLLDPVNENTLSIFFGIQPPKLLSELGGLWDQVMGFIAARPEISRKLVLSGLYPWVYPRTMSNGEQINPECREILRTTARRLVLELADIYMSKPIVMRRLSAMAQDLDLRIAHKQDEMAHALYGLRHPSKQRGYVSPREIPEPAHAAVRAQASRRLNRTPSDLAAEISQVETDVAAAGEVPPPLLPAFAAALASQIESPVSFASNLVEQRCSYSVMLAVVSALGEQPADDIGTLAEQLLGNDRYHRIGTSLALRSDAPESARSRALTEFQTNQADDVVGFYREGQLSAAELRRIVEDYDSQLGQEVAVIACYDAWAGDREPLELAESVREICHNRVAHYRRWEFRAPQRGWMLEHVLRRDPSLCANWIENWLILASKNAAGWLPDDIESIAAALHKGTKLRLIGQLPASLSSYFAGELVRGLVTGDDQLFHSFFGRKDLDHLRPALFAGEWDEEWRRCVALGREVGCSPKQIAQWTAWAGFGWVGDESAEWERRIELLEEMRNNMHDEERELLLDVIDACIAAFERREAEAALAEKRERILGRG